MEKCLIEPDGRHHFIKVSYWKTDPDKVRARDVKKMKWALANDFSVLRISQQDVWDGRINWKEILEKYIGRYVKPTIKYFAADLHLYDKHKADMKL